LRKKAVACTKESKMKTDLSAILFAGGQPFRPNRKKALQSERNGIGFHGKYEDEKMI
jgi:hypothetical protein